LRAGQRILELQEQLLAAREALRQEATHDSLTGLLNRHAILGVLQIELERASRESQHIAVLMADLDHFKQINDRYGHLAGDAVLRESATRMRESSRRYDSLGRYGGEEFLMVLPGCNAEGALAQAERMRRSMAAAPIGFGDHSAAVTCSIGLACRPPEMRADTDSLVLEADLALYAAKANGRNQVVATCVETLHRN
jgi:diguanylate cyclase (GGDEF)-like protein